MVTEFAIRFLVVRFDIIHLVIPVLEWPREDERMRWRAFLLASYVSDEEYESGPQSLRDEKRDYYLVHYSSPLFASSTYGPEKVMVPSTIIRINNRSPSLQSLPVFLDHSVKRFFGFHCVFGSPNKSTNTVFSSSGGSIMLLPPVAVQWFLPPLSA